MVLSQTHGRLIWYGERVQKTRPALFRRRHFEDHVIVLCVRWYLRYCLTLRDLEEMMMERGLAVDHSTIGRWVLRYAPELHKRLRRELRPPNRSWRVDETYIRVAGAWTYLYRAVDSTGATIDFMLSPKRDVVAAKHFLQMALWRAGDGRANGATPPALRFQVQRFIVCFMILPASEDDSNPFIGQRPYCCLMRLAAVSLESIIGSSPL